LSRCCYGALCVCCRPFSATKRAAGLSADVEALERKVQQQHYVNHGSFDIDGTRENVNRLISELQVSCWNI